MRPPADRPASQTDIHDRIDRVAIGGTAILIRLSEVREGDDSVKTLTLSWQSLECLTDHFRKTLDEPIPALPVG